MTDDDTPAARFDRDRADNRPGLPLRYRYPGERRDRKPMTLVEMAAVAFGFLFFAAILLGVVRTLLRSFGG